MLIAAGVVVLVAVAGGAGAGTAEIPDAVGRPLALHHTGAQMRAVNAPARIARVAVVPGSPIGEAWALGFSRAREPGFDQTTPAGQVVFLRYTRATGWRVYGPPLNEDGRPFNGQLADLAMTSRGEGWATGNEGVLFHRAPGGPWRMHPSSGVTRNAIFDLSLREDARGVYGFAVGANLSFLRLDAGRWTLDVPVGGAPTPGGAGVPDLVGVTTISRQTACATSGSNVNSLMIFCRTPEGAWDRSLTGRPMFDTAPAPVSGESGATVNQFARGASITSVGSTVWVGGMMQPVDASRPVNDASGQDRTRPFVVRVAGDVVTSFCPLQYQLATSGVGESDVESTVEICDEPLPFATGDLPTLTAAGNEVYAGGLGLFRFRRGAWERAPSVLGSIVSASFASAEEGWLATAGDVVGGGPVAFSSSITVGHWTSEAPTPHVRRWPHADERTLSSVARAPTGRGAMAVGVRGALLRLDARAGWEPMASPTTAHLNALAWPRARESWAVGAGGTIARFDGARWSLDPASGRLTTKPLYAVAFDAAGARGVAVGAGGVIVRYEGGRWRPDPVSRRITERRLSSVAFAGDDVIAVGDGGVILTREGGTWRTDRRFDEALRSGQEGTAPNLLAVAGLPDGAAVIGGARSVVIERSPDGSMRLGSLPPIEGTIHTLAATRTPSGALAIVASIAPSGTSRFAGESIGVAQGRVVARVGNGWMDIGAGHPSAGLPDIDAPVARDGAFGIALERGGRAGWIVGGTPEDVTDDDGHMRASSSASVWRFDLDRPPSPSPAAVSAEVVSKPGAVAFAFLGDTACATGLCSAALGLGTRADVIMTAALAQIERTARAGQIRHLLLGGDIRRNGIPDEIEPVRALLASMSVPVFGAIGDKDLFAGIGSSTDQQSGLLGSNGYFLQRFKDMPAPWGHGRAVRGFVPAEPPGGSAEADPGAARTHYAFDLAPDGEPVLRFVVLDTSQLPLAAGVEGQNPREDQVPWLQAVLTDARTRALPSIVVMHNPQVVPASSGTDAVTLTGILTAPGAASAVLASHSRANLLFHAPDANVPDAIPVAISGSAGSPLASSWRPERGAYHAWLLVEVDADPDARTLTGRAPVRVRSVPILESIALRAVRGRVAPSGRTLRFSALGRTPDTGGAHGLGRAADANQARATYLPMPFPRTCTLLDPSTANCRTTTAMEPDFRFISEDPQIADFVRADPTSPNAPFKDAQGRLVRDARSGLLCTFQPGETAIRIEAGTAGARTPIRIGSGSGPCAGPRFAPAGPDVQPGVEPGQVAAKPAGQQPHLLRPNVPDAGAVAALAPPIVNAAPAPPASGGGARQEKREAASERSDFRALPAARRADDPSSIPIGALGLVGLAAVALAGARAGRRRTIRGAAVATRPIDHTRHQPIARRNP